MILQYDSLFGFCYTCVHAHPTGGQFRFVMRSGHAQLHSNSGKWYACTQPAIVGAGSSHQAADDPYAAHQIALCDLGLPDDDECSHADSLQHPIKCTHDKGVMIEWHFGTTSKAKDRLVWAGWRHRIFGPDMNVLDKTYLGSPMEVHNKILADGGINRSSQDSCPLDGALLATPINTQTSLSQFIFRGSALNLFHRIGGMPRHPTVNPLNEVALMGPVHTTSLPIQPSTVPVTIPGSQISVNAGEKTIPNITANSWDPKEWPHFCQCGSRGIELAFSFDCADKCASPNRKAK